MRLFLMISLITMLSTPLHAYDRGQPSTLSENWISRPAPEPPSTNEEILAVLAASEQRDIIEKNVVIKYDGIRSTYETVTVITLPESDSELQIISRYRILNNLIYADTHPIYKTWISPEKEKQQKLAEHVAYQLAVNANGKNSDRPLMYEDKMLAVTFDGICNATVIEINYAHEVMAEYHFRMCD